MQLQWTPDQMRLRGLYREIGREMSVRPRATDAFDQSAWDAVRAAGLWRLIVPAELGGDGRDWWGFTSALEGLASSLRAPGILLSIIAQAGMVRALDRFGTEAQKKHYLPRILAGELTATAIADPDTGTDVRATSSILTPQANETFALNGSKYNIAHAPVAGFILVICKLDDHERSGISLALVDASMPGVHAGPRDDKLGNRDLPTGSLRFEDVRLDYGHMLGVPGEGLRNLVDIVSLGRLYYGLVAAAMLEPMLAEALAYAQQRETFGVPILEHQHVQRRLTDICIGMESGKWVAYGALSRLLAGTPDSVMLCSIAKLVGADAVVDSALDLLRLYGSKGYHEGPVTDFLRNALAFCAVGGTDEMHRRNIMNQMIRLAPKAGAVSDRAVKPAHPDREAKPSPVPVQAAVA